MAGRINKRFLVYHKEGSCEKRFEVLAQKLTQMLNQDPPDYERAIAQVEKCVTDRTAALKEFNRIGDANETHDDVIRLIKNLLTVLKTLQQGEQKVRIKFFDGKKQFYVSTELEPIISVFEDKTVPTFINGKFLVKQNINRVSQRLLSNFPPLGSPPTSRPNSPASFGRASPILAAKPILSGRVIPSGYTLANAVSLAETESGRSSPASFLRKARNRKTRRYRRKRRNTRKLRRV